MSEQKFTMTRAVMWLGFLAVFWIISYIILMQKFSGQGFVLSLSIVYAIFIGSALFFVQWIIIPRISFFNQSSQTVIKAIVYGAAFTIGYFPGWLVEIMWKYSNQTKTDLISYTTTTIKNMVAAIFTGKPVKEAIPPELIDAFTSIFFVLFLIVILSSIAGYIDSRWRKERMIRQVQENQIRFLQAQMQPHFLFNTLNTITSMVAVEPRKAEKLLIGLSDFLRFNMDYSKRESVDLKEEIEFLENYLMLIKARFGVKLNWRIAVSPELESLPVPTLLLQPLVENAIKHGWIDRDKDFKIEISAVAVHPDMIIEIGDDGCGFDVEKRQNFPPPGHALELLQNRIKLISGKNSAFSILSKTGEGTTVKMRLPL